MKTNILLAVCGILCTIACHPVTEFVPADGTGSLVISVSPLEGLATKSDTNPAGKDAYLHDVQVFIFRTDGSLHSRVTFPENVTSQSVEGVKAGYYQVVAVANGPDLSSVKTRSELEQKQITLSLNDPEKGFLMYGASAGNVVVNSGTDSETAVAIELKRHVGRVRLTTVRNNLPSDFGSLKVESVFLENGLGSWTYQASGDPSGYINFAGRKTGKSTSSNAADFIAAAGDADCAALTFHSTDRSVARGETPESFNLSFYTFPNKLSADDDHFGATSGAACTRLVLLVSYGTGGERWYYPVTVPQLERNKSYDVSFVISGPGSADPNQRVTNGNLSVEVSVKTWEEGTDFNGDF